MPYPAAVSRMKASSLSDSSCSGDDLRGRRPGQKGFLFVISLRTNSRVAESIPPEKPTRTRSPSVTIFCSRICFIVLRIRSGENFTTLVLGHMPGGRHEQLEQSDDEQPVQPPPDLPEDLNLFPTEKPNDDIFFCRSLSPHAGHSGISSPKIITSNSLPHFRQVYSYIGIETSCYLLFFLISPERSAISLFKGSRYRALMLFIGLHIFWRFRQEKGPG